MKKKENKNIIQSFVFTTSRYDFSVYEKRVLTGIVKELQYIYEGKKLNTKYYIQDSLFDNIQITMPVRDLLSHEEDKNYFNAKNVLRSMGTKWMEYEDDEIWEGFHLIESPQIDKSGGYVSFNVNRHIVKSLLDMSKGYRRYEFKIMMSLRSEYAMRFYELMSEQQQPITYKIETLKKMLGLTDKYDRLFDLKRRVLDTAKKELDESSPYSFDYMLLPEKAKTKTSIRLTPIYHPGRVDEELEKKNLQKQIALSWDLDSNLVKYLKDNFDFTTDGIKNNIEIFKEAQDKIDLLGFLTNIKRKANDANNPQGYIISAIRKQMEQM